MEIGIVEKIIDHHHLLVKITELGECETCPGKTSCHANPVKGHTIKAEYNDNEDIKVNDPVEINFKPGARITASLITFVIPIVALFIFYYIGWFFFKKELLAIILSITGLIITIAIIILYYRNNGKNNLTPLVTKITDQKFTG